MNSQIDWNLILRYLNGEATQTDREQLEFWLKSDYEHRKLMNLVERIWNSPETPRVESDVKAAWERLSKKSGISIPFEQKRPAQIYSMPARRRIPQLRILRYAALFLMALSLGYVYKAVNSSFQEKPDNELQKIAVDYGQTASLTLADGTKITLDSGSTLQYPEKFEDAAREVQLQGEALFEVAPDPEKPFIITANKAVIRVIGTKFNVRAWPEIETVRVTVAEGKVSLRSVRQEDNAAVLVAAGQMSLLDKRERVSKPVFVDVRQHLAWLNREIILDNTPLFEVLEQLERWYRIRFELPSPIYNSIKISGTIKRKPIDDIIEAISLMVNLESKRQGDRVLFMEKSPSN